ncbi:1-(5-phosphoribosyl)-5-[(5-phosphoribosylamino)methylideneamino]imidazole-4-carboxamide isomerase [Candidatus Aerophobetes bacterium]|nr:1-(5-phosphoribosyl)-5-[(5-phosphoribosylamino)methylideneamino]imidazole-4-carboxamide isomerase [Candidatus Aerophobetes bacterium]
MLVIPAIDLKGGKCVRLWQGIKDKETVYSHEPLQVAKLWIDKGAKRLHIVDLDGAFSGIPQHLPVAESIKKSFSITLQYGGGIRTLKILKGVFEKGINFAIIGTKALSKSFLQNAIDKFGERIIISIDCKEDKLALEGWEKETSIEIQEFARNVTDIGIKTIILTDITRDGTLRGVNIELIEDFLKNVNCNLIVAGGISSLEDIKWMKKLEDKKIKGIIIGKALYTGAIKLEEALKIADED